LAEHLLITRISLKPSPRTFLALPNRPGDRRLISFELLDRRAGLITRLDGKLDNQKQSFPISNDIDISARRIPLPYRG